MCVGLIAGCASAPPQPATGFPTNTAPALMSLALPPATPYTGYAPPLNVVTTTLTWPAAAPPMRYPMDWIEFTVRLTNTSDTALSQLEPDIVMGQCTCNPAKYFLRPYDVLQVWDTQLNGWRNINTAIQKTDGSFTSSQQIPPLDLAPRAAVTVKYRIQLANPAKEQGLVDGSGSLNIYVLQLPGRQRVITDLGPDATEPLTYVFTGGPAPKPTATPVAPPTPTSS